MFEHMFTLLNPCPGEFTRDCNLLLTPPLPFSFSFSTHTHTHTHTHIQRGYTYTEKYNCFKLTRTVVRPHLCQLLFKDSFLQCLGRRKCLNKNKVCVCVCVCVRGCVCACVSVCV